MPTLHCQVATLIISAGEVANRRPDGFGGFVLLRIPDVLKGTKHELSFGFPGPDDAAGWGW